MAHRRLARMRRLGTRAAELRWRLLRRFVQQRFGVESEDALKLLSQQWGVPYSTITRNVRQLEAQGVARRTVMINPYQTPFCHEFRIDVLLDGQQLKKAWEEARQREDVTAAGPQEWFIEDVMEAISLDPAVREHAIIADAAIIHGAAEHDIEFVVFADDGIFSVGQYVRSHLRLHSCVTTATTVATGWRYRFNGYSGAFASRPEVDS
jgi:hypothetical protein